MISPHAQAQILIAAATGGIAIAILIAFAVGMTLLRMLTYRQPRPPTDEEFWP